MARDPKVKRGRCPSCDKTFSWGVDSEAPKTCPHCGALPPRRKSEAPTETSADPVASPKEGGPRKASMSFRATDDEARTKRCPYCAEEILEDAVKCKHCGEFLDDSPGSRGGTVGKPTFIKVVHRGRKTILKSDGGPEGLIEVIIKAVKTSDYILNSVNRDDGVIEVESSGMTFQSFAGDDIRFQVSGTEGISRAVVQAKGKPTGLLRVQWRSSAKKHVRKLLPHFNVEVR